MTAAQRRTLDRYLDRDRDFRVTYHAGPNQDRIVAAFGDGRLIVVGPDGSVVADSHRATGPAA